MTEVESIRYRCAEDFTRVVIDLTKDAPFSENHILNPERVFVDIKGSILQPYVKKDINVNCSSINAVRVAQYDQRTVRVVLDIRKMDSYKVFRLAGPSRVVIDVFGYANGDGAERKAIMAKRKAAEERRLAEQKRLAEERRLAQQRARTAEAERLAEDRQFADIKLRAEEKARQVADAKRLAEEKRRLAERERLAEEARIAEERRLAEEAARVAEAKRLEEEKRLAEQERLAEEQRLAEQRRIAEQQRLAEEKSIAEAREAKLARVKKMAKAKEVFKPQGRVVVIDAGHGGHDPGALGPGGIKEKNIVLDVAKRLKKELEARGGYEVYLTRDRDEYLSLEERTMVANDKGADLFISVHANAHNSASVKGLETYYLNYTNEREALRVAARENKISVRRMQKQRSEKDVILASLQLDNNVHESRRLANYVQGAMVSQVDRQYKSVKDLGVKNALFYVLVGAKMPSVLVEVAFITNPTEAKRLQSKTYRAGLAKGIAGGVDKYFDTLPPEQKIAMKR
jgi:N-acetylmuramoyl-L-alanine amidase